jgi:hypothetical protein
MNRPVMRPVHFADILTRSHNDCHGTQLPRVESYRFRIAGYPVGSYSTLEHAARSRHHSTTQFDTNAIDITHDLMACIGLLYFVLKVHS